MVAVSAAKLWILLSCLACTAICTKVGDEGYADLSPNITGVFYAFADKTIHVINPALGTVIKNITVDDNGRPLTNLGALGGSANTSRSWNDPVYMEDATGTKGYIFINEGDVYTLPSGREVSYVTVIDTATDKIVARVEVGPNPVHIYGVPLTNEVWTHPDKGGDFYVIDHGNGTKFNSTIVPGLVRKAGHGKLLVDATLVPRAYGTNVNEQYLYEYDLVARKRVASHDFSVYLPANASCTGTHAIGYSSISEHVYAECIGAGVLEWDAVNNVLVKFWPYAGSTVATPGNDYILVVNKMGNRVAVLEPTENGKPAKFLYEVPVPDNPAVPKFYTEKAQANGSLEDYLVYFPLTRNTNINNIQAASLLGADVTSKEFHSQPADCKYAPANVRGAVRAESVSLGGLSLAKNATGGLLTPACGACAPGFNPVDPSQWDATLSGFRVLTLAHVAKNMTAPLVPAGAVLRRKDTRAYGPSAECSFASAYRQAKRGGRFVATVADLPEPAVYFVEASTTPTVAKPVRTAAGPKQISWAPLVPAL